MSRPEPPALFSCLERLALVRLLALDVDGVLTDGTLTFGSEAVAQKHFHVADGLGIVVLQQAGIPVVWLSGRAERGTSWRAQELKVARLVADARDKGAVLQQIQQDFGVSQAQVAYIGDDWNDLLAFARAGIRIAVPDAAPALLAQADAVTLHRGGQGAVREVCEAILTAQGRLESVLEEYLAGLRDAPADGAAGQ